MTEDRGRSYPLSEDRTEREREKWETRFELTHITNPKMFGSTFHLFFSFRLSGG